MEKNNNISENHKNEFIFNFIKNINDIKTRSLEIKNNNYINSLDKNLLKEKDKKIEDLQKQCEELKKQLEIKNDIKQKEKEKEQNTSLKNKSKNFIDNNFNTSTNFPVKNEIKKIWEELALVSILDTFIDYESEPLKIFHLVCEMILIMDKLINDLCREIYEKVSLSLNIPTNDKKFINDIEKISRPLIKEHLNKIFIDTENKPFIDKFIYLFQNSINNNNIFNCIKKDKDLLEQIIKGEEFNQMTKKIKDIMLYTKFNDQQLFFKIEPDIKKRNVEKLIINNINEKKKYLIINDNNLINYPAIVILNPPVMKNGFPLNNDFKTIVMLINDNNFINKDLKTNIIDRAYKIYANSFTIMDNDKKKSNNKENKYLNTLNIYKDKTLSLPGTRNNEYKDKNKAKLKLELKTTINKTELEEKSKRTYREKIEKNNNYFNNSNTKNNSNNNNNANLKNSAYNIQKQKDTHISINNINNTYFKQHKTFIDEHYRNKNSFCNLNQPKQEIFYDSLLQSEYVNSPKNASDNSSIQDQDILISINHDEIKKLQSINIHNNLDISNSLYKNNCNYIKNKNNLIDDEKKRYSLNDVNHNGKNLSISRRNIKQKKIQKALNNHSDKNIYKNMFTNENVKYVRHNTKDICSTEITTGNNCSNCDSLCLKKYRTVKEMSKGKNNTNNNKNEDKYIISLNNEQSNNISARKNLYKNNGRRIANHSKRSIDLFKEQLKIKKKRIQMNNINSNYNSHKFEKNNSYKNKIVNNNNNNNDYKNIQHENIKKIINYSPHNSNMIFISTKNYNNNKNKINKQSNKKDNVCNTSNIRRRGKINTYTYNNNSYNSNNISGNNRQHQMSSSSTIVKNSTINTGFKIKNVNINYFNIMQPNELFFNHQRTNRSISKPNISNKNNNFKNTKKNNNLKTNKYSNMNKNDNSLFIMTDLIELQKLKDNLKKERKGKITKLSELRKHNDSCLSNDVVRTKMNSNEIKKIRITKQSIRLNDGYTLNCLDRNKSGIPKKKNFIGNFATGNNKQISYIKIPNKTSNNTSKLKNVNNRAKISDRQNNNTNNNYIIKSNLLNSQTKRNSDYYNTHNVLTQTFSNNINNIISNGNNNCVTNNNIVSSQNNLIH